MVMRLTHGGEHSHWTVRSIAMGRECSKDTAMALDLLVSEYADFCPVCTEMAVLCWTDSDLNEGICEDCAECLVEAEQTLLKFNLDRPSPELIDRNP